METIKIDVLKRSMSYDEYIQMVGKLVETESTSGPDQSLALVNYTKLNYKRMTRLNKTTKISQDLIDTVNAITFNMKWVVISEAWCGDAAQNLPFIAQLAKASANVEIHIVLRDENLEFMDKYLTQGSRSIPKAIFMRADNLEELSVWGPRPETIQEKTRSYKNEASPKLSYEEFSESIHTWYAKDKNLSLEKELLATFRSIKDRSAIEH